MTLLETVSIVATVTVIAMELGPAPAVFEILKNRSTGVTPFVPLVALGTNGWMWSMYGYLGGNIFPVAISNFIGAVLSAIYTLIYYHFTHERAYANKVLGFFGSIVAATTLFAIAGVHGYTGQTHEQVQSVLGLAGVTTVFMFFASPFENIALVFRHRNAIYIPILLVAIGAINSAMWSLYSYLASDWFIFVPNFGALMLGLVQITLYFVFHPSKVPQEYPSAEYASKNLEESLEAAPLHQGEAHSVAPLQSQTERTAYGAINA